MDIDVEGSEDGSELDQKQSSKSVDVLHIVQVAQLDVLVTVELPHSLIEEVLFEVALRQSYQQFSYEATNRQLDVDVAVVIA